jgi:hypothetical protein
MPAEMCRRSPISALDQPPAASASTSSSRAGRGHHHDLGLRIGPANWALPGWLDRLLPRLAVEAADPATDPEGALS